MQRITALLLVALLAAFPAVAQESYPSRTITLVVPYAPGGGSDFLGRILADGLKTRLNETVVVQCARRGQRGRLDAGRQGQA